MLAGRDPPAAPWRADAGWRQLVAVHRLEHFDADESAELLAHAGVAPEVRPHLVMLGARASADHRAARRPRRGPAGCPDALADAPDLISALLESFLRDVPSDAHLTGLAACAIAWLTTEDLLARMVGAEAPEVWRWLARRPFVTRGPRGLFAHDLAREVLDAEFERRMPERYHAHRRVIHAHTVAGLRATTGPDRQRHAQQLLFLQRNSPFATAFSALRALGSAAVVPGRADDHDQVCADRRTVRRAVRRRARPGLAPRAARTPLRRAYARGCRRVSPCTCSAPAARRWRIGTRPSGPSSTTSHGTDPRVRANWSTSSGSSRALAEYERDPYAVLAAPVSSVIEWLTRPLAWSVGITSTPSSGGPGSSMWGSPRSSTSRSTAGGRSASASTGDACPSTAWLDLMRERGHSGETGPPPAELLRPPPLDRNRFAVAVKAVLPVLHRPDQLAASSLMGSALATTAVGPSPAQLRATIEAAVARLADEPKGEQLRAVLHRTYLRPAPTQEAAAQVLDLPLSTYRRYLARAVEHLTDLLWTVEIGDVRLPTE